MKSVGIITMHKVWNAGSALQAYALQRVIEDLGYDAQLIDYEYPNVEHRAFANNVKEFNTLDIWGVIKLLVQKIKTKFIRHKHSELYSSFYNKYFHCTDKAYNSRKSLFDNVPEFDIYVTGSDQVWNPQYIGFDTSYLLDFVPDNAVRISYAASFSINNIPSYMEGEYTRCLSKYKVISVREESGSHLVNKLIGEDATVCCDPTLLLDKEQWSKVAEDSSLCIKKKFILIYIMGYAYDPYPGIYKHIDEVVNFLKLPVIFYNSRRGTYKPPYGEIRVDECGPTEFLWLFKNASFVITDSFHGTAFSLNFQKPFISVIKEIENADSRVYNLLVSAGATDRAVICGEDFELKEAIIKEPSTSKLEELREGSLAYLRTHLNQE